MKLGPKYKAMDMQQDQESDHMYLDPDNMEYKWNSPLIETR